MQSILTSVSVSDEVAVSCCNAPLESSPDPTNGLLSNATGVAFFYKQKLEQRCKVRCQLIRERHADRGTAVPTELDQNPRRLTIFCETQMHHGCDICKVIS